MLHDRRRNAEVKEGLCKHFRIPSGKFEEFSPEERYLGVLLKDVQNNGNLCTSHL